MSEEYIINTTILKLLYKRSVSIPLTESEDAALREWVASSSYGEVLLHELQNKKWLQSEIKNWQVADKEKIWNTIDFTSIAASEEQRLQEQMVSATLPAHRIPSIKTGWLRYAAVLLLISGTAAFLYFHNQKPGSIITQSTTAPTDLPPGKSQAILTLANGEKIILDDASVGALAREGNTHIVKVNAGQIAYKAGAAEKDSLNNTISTPKGGQYQIVLSDGTNVWLNAASSITFPTAFGEERKVTITGEAYLEVTANSKKPFIVVARETQIHVLGTAFNINAYSDEASIKTVLAEGSVQVMNGGKPLTLKPGQECASVPGSPLVAVKADLEQALAWKNGTFFFRRTNFADAMRQLSRWYDVDVKYKDGIPDILLGGEMKRELTLSQVLETLGEFGVSFQINKKQLTVMNDSPVK